MRRLEALQLPGRVSVLQVRQEPEAWPLKDSVGPARSPFPSPTRVFGHLTARGKCPVNMASHVRTLAVGVSPGGPPLVSSHSGTDPHTRVSGARVISGVMGLLPPGVGPACSYVDAGRSRASTLGPHGRWFALEPVYAHRRRAASCVCDTGIEGGASLWCRLSERWRFCGSHGPHPSPQPFASLPFRPC